MGADIHSFVEVRVNGKWIMVEEPVFDDYGDKKTTEPFGWRSYSVFGFLADVRNYSHCTPICQPKGLPDDSEWLNAPSKYAYDVNPMSGEHIPENERGTNKEYIEEGGCYSVSWLTLKELLDFNYEQTFWDRRIIRTTIVHGSVFTNCAALAKKGEGKVITYREHLGEGFFNDIEVLKSLGSPEDVRIVFWFD